MTGYAYSEAHIPAAPILPVRLASPLDREGILVPCLVDTGADISVFPRALVEQLDLPEVDVVTVEDYAGQETSLAVYAAKLVFEGQGTTQRILAAGEQALVGRDILNRFRITLDGPRQRCEFS